MVWLTWLDEDYNYPSRTDYYLMAVAMHVLRPWTRQRMALDDFRLEFKRAEQSKKSHLEEDKRRFAQFLGAGDIREFRVRLPDGTIKEPEQSPKFVVQRPPTATPREAVTLDGNECQKSLKLKGCKKPKPT